ncbi:hypothetical protein PIB30_049623 [Stylosanthes scabra]|uniref:Uncharacterized protein n=1 Tax=Stylosanthes scabra TaxID=79078 RepID=A0ABU6ZG93_9FABA|nr:hypothetical protein [Stylosanthes scabra]
MTKSFKDAAAEKAKEENRGKARMVESKEDEDTNELASSASEEWKEAWELSVNLHKLGREPTLYVSSPTLYVSFSIKKQNLGVTPRYMWESHVVRGDLKLNILKPRIVILIQDLLSINYTH